MRVAPVMPTLLGLLLLWPAGVRQAPAAGVERVTYYVQLVRGNNEERPPEAANQPVGPKLSSELRRVWGWKSYWEVSRRKVEMPSAGKSRLRLGAGREVEIDLSVPGKRKIIAYSEGKPVAEIIRPAGQKITIIGGDRDSHSAWFIAVRRDQPTED